MPHYFLLFIISNLLRKLLVRAHQSFIDVKTEMQYITNLAHGEHMEKQVSCEIGNSTGGSNLSSGTCPRVQNKYDKLTKVIAAIRTLESTSIFEDEHQKTLQVYHETMIIDNKEREYSDGNFAYGQVFYQGFHRLFTTHPVAIDAVKRANVEQLDWFSLGSNIGTETFYSAVALDLNSIGYDVLCPLVEHSKTFRTQFNLESKTNFHCKDALDADLSNAGIIWVDNQAWDENLSNNIYAKLNQDMIPGALMIEYAMADHNSIDKLFFGDKLEVVGCSNIETSWATLNGVNTVSIFQKTESVLRKRLQSIRKMVNDVGTQVLNGPLTILANNRNEPNNHSTQEELLNLNEELQNLELLAREDTTLSSVQFVDRVLSLYSTVLFNWYHTNTFKQSTKGKNNTRTDGTFNQDETQTNYSWSRFEIHYLRTFAALSGKEFRTYGHGIRNRMAEYSYSHTFGTVDSTEIVSSRARIGTTLNFKELWNSAKYIIQERGLILDEKIVHHLNENNGHGPLYSFHGLEWDNNLDGDNGPDSVANIKISIAFHSYNALKDEYAKLSGESVSRFCLEGGLLSFVYSNDNKNSIETILIMYPRNNSDVEQAGLEIPNFTATTMLMFSSEQGLIPMFNLERNRLCAWYSEFSTNIGYVIDKWTHIGGNLETIGLQSWFPPSAFKDSTGERFEENAITLYFPNVYL